MDVKPYDADFSPVKSCLLHAWRVASLPTTTATTLYQLNIDDY